MTISTSPDRCYGCNSANWSRRKRFTPQTNGCTMAQSRGARVWGKFMNRSTQLRFAAAVLFAIAAFALTGLPARAFSQGNGGTGDGGNSAFADPDEQVNMFGFDQGPQPTGLSGSVQNSPRPDQFKYYRPDSLAFPPDPLSRPGN